MPRTFDEYSESIRSLANRGRELKLQKLQVMTELIENHEELWSDRYGSATELLRAEKWETPSYYFKFRKGMRDLGKEVVNKVGPEVTCLLSTYSAKDRNKILASVLDWIKRQRIAPHYQLVATYAKSVLPPKERKLTKAEKNLRAMTRYAGELQGILRKNSITFPSAPVLL